MQRKGGKGESVCAICDGAVPRKTSLSTLIAPCCSAFLHKDCIQVDYLVSLRSFHEIGLLRVEHLEAVGGNVPVVEMMSSG